MLSRQLCLMMIRLRLAGDADRGELSRGTEPKRSRGSSRVRPAGSCPTGAERRSWSPGRLVPTVLVRVGFVTSGTLLASRLPCRVRRRVSKSARTTDDQPRDPRTVIAADAGEPAQVASAAWHGSRSETRWMTQEPGFRVVCKG
jgi:hypothetical protein